MSELLVAPMLVFIVGPPAVGKMAVGHELAARTGFRLFHNHHTIDLVLRFFDYGTPPFRRLVGEFRRRTFEEVAARPHRLALSSSDRCLSVAGN